MNIKYLGKEREMVETAFSRAFKEAAKEKKTRNKTKDLKNKEVKKIAVAANFLYEKLIEAVGNFPKINELRPFYRELISATVDVDELKKSLSQMVSTAKIIVNLKKEYISKTYKLHKDSTPEDARRITKAFLGRTSSVMKKCRKSFEVYENARKKFQEIPKVEFDTPTVIIAGLPNTGKSTILKRLTKSEPEIASYPFTTKSLKIGYFECGHQRVQVIDTPGLLDRPLEKRNPIEKKAISALSHLGNLIVFVIDPTPNCGFSLEKQLALFEELKKNFKLPIIAVVNKVDDASDDEIGNAKALLKEYALEGEGISSNLKPLIAEKLGIGK